MAEQVSRQLDKLPPQATDMERAVLGAMLIDPDSIGLTIELLKETDFYKPGHAAIYRALTDLFDANLPVDQLTVSEQLKKKKQLELIGGEPTISALINDTASSANIRYHSHVIREKALLRRLISDTTASHTLPSAKLSFRRRRKFSVKPRLARVSPALTPDLKTSTN